MINRLPPTGDCDTCQGRKTCRVVCGAKKREDDKKQAEFMHQQQRIRNMIAQRLAEKEDALYGRY